MKNELASFVGLVVPGLFVIMMLCVSWYGYGRDEVRKEAVEVGHAHYDPQTRQFKWGKYEQ